MCASQSRRRRREGQLLITEQPHERVSIDGLLSDCLCTVRFALVHLKSRDHRALVKNVHRAAVEIVIQKCVVEGEQPIRKTFRERTAVGAVDPLTQVKDDVLCHQRPIAGVGAPVPRLVPSFFWVRLRVHE